MTNAAKDLAEFPGSTLASGLKPRSLSSGRPESGDDGELHREIFG